MNILPVDRALSLYGTLADRTRDEGRPCTAFQAFDAIVHRGRKRRALLDGARTVRTFAIWTGQSTPETDNHLWPGISPSGLSLLPQGIAPHNSCFRDADCFHPCLQFFRQGVFFFFGRSLMPWPAVGLARSSCARQACTLIGPMDGDLLLAIRDKLVAAEFVRWLSEGALQA